jgi:hypothetical protein
MNMKDERSRAPAGAGTKPSGEGPRALRGRAGRPVRARTAVAFIALFIAGAVAGYVIFTKDIIPLRTGETGRPGTGKVERTVLNIYYPYNGRLNMEDRKVAETTSRMSVAEAVVREFLRGPENSPESYVPEGVELLGIYPGNDGILYIDLSSELRINFRGDALAEFLLLRGLYESLVSNVYGVEGVKVIIEGEEVDSIGGHVSITYPLSEIVSHTLMEDVDAK